MPLRSYGVPSGRVGDTRREGAFDTPRYRERTLRAAQLAVEDQSVDVTDLQLTYAPAGADCGWAGELLADPDAREEIFVCVTVTVRIRCRPSRSTRTQRPGSSWSSATATPTLGGRVSRARPRSRPRPVHPVPGRSGGWCGTSSPTTPSAR